jgi:hypothetical protein
MYLSDFDALTDERAKNSDVKYLRQGKKYSPNLS